MTHRAEGWLIRHAARIVVLTEALRRELCGALPDRSDNILVIPCCVDTDRFRPDALARAKRRAEIGVGEGTRLVAFAGGISRYDLPATARLIAQLRRRGDARLLLVTRDDPGSLLCALGEAGCGQAVHVVSATPDEVPGWLAAADLAVSLLRDCRSSIAASPTKVAEALAAGLPTVISQNVAENNGLLGAGILVMPPGDAGPHSCAEAVQALLREPAAAQADARAAAVRHFSLLQVGIARYRTLYEQFS